MPSDGRSGNRSAVESCIGLNEELSVTARYGSFVGTRMSHYRFPVILAAGLVALITPLRAQETVPADALLDVLVWGSHMRIDPTAYPPTLRAEVEAYLR